jgi:hypothetical protein
MMKKITLLFSLLTIFYGFSQNNPINFEEGGNGADWTWVVFENDSNPPLEIIENPDQSGINTSQTVAKFTALETGNPWAGCESLQGADLGEFVLDDSNNVISIMVWKSVISDVGIKLVSSTDWAQPEIKIPNTLINQWEKITFDFSDYINPPDGNGVLNQIVVFPDFDLSGRGQDNIIYFDNIVFGDEGLSTPTNEFSSNFVAYPNPSSNYWTITGKTQSSFSAQLYDVTGKLISVYENVANQDLTIDASSLKAGIYFATVTTEKASSTIKLIKR